MAPAASAMKLPTIGAIPYIKANPFPCISLGKLRLIREFNIGALIFVDPLNIGIKAKNQFPLTNANKINKGMDIIKATFRAR